MNSVVAAILISYWMAAQAGLTLVWDQAEVTPGEAQGYTYRIFWDDSTAGVLLPAVQCRLSALKVTECAAPLPIPALGNHKIQISAENAFGEGPKSTALSFRYPATPDAPTNLRIIR